VNAVLAIRRASLAIAGWTHQPQPMVGIAPVPVLRISPPASDPAKLAARNVTSQAQSEQVAAQTVPAQTVPAMIAAGITRPRVLMSAAVESLLSAQELRSALNHEVAHVHRRDNLKKLLLRFVAFPGMAAFEAAWLKETEMAADDEAVGNAAEALDLAAALIKLSRITPAGPDLDLTAALLHSPASLVNARVERLLTWNERNEECAAVAQRWSLWCGLAAFLIASTLFSVTYSQLLVHIHTATEWLVR
jgi:Zn-dependent protease with chaperone function